jgi:hypothetical protein
MVFIDIVVYTLLMMISKHALHWLMRDFAKKKPSAILVYLYLSSQTKGRALKTSPLSFQHIADSTFLSKSTAQKAVGILKGEWILECPKATVTSTPEYRVPRPRRGK